MINKEENLEVSERLKLQGNEAFKNKDFQKAFQLYSEAINSSGTTASLDKVAIYYSNRALSLSEMAGDAKKAKLKKKKLRSALSDLEKSIELNPKNSKPYYLKSLLLFNLEEFESSQNAMNTLQENFKITIPEAEALKQKIQEKLKNKDEDSDDDEAFPGGRDDRGNGPFFTNKGIGFGKIDQNDLGKVPLNSDWAKGLLLNQQYDWLMDCYRMRIDDECVYKGIMRGLYDDESQAGDILKDFLLFCLLAKKKEALPNKWSWEEFLRIAEKSILSAFEKEDAKDKYGGENYFRSMMGGRSLRFTGEVIYSTSAINFSDSGGDKIYKDLLKKVDSIKIKDIKDFKLNEEIFKEVGRTGAWIALFNHLEKNLK